MQSLKKRTHDGAGYCHVAVGLFCLSFYTAWQPIRKECGDPPPLSLLYIIFSMPLLAIQCSGNFRTSTGVSCQPSGFSRRSIWLDGALPSGLASLCRPTCLCSSASKPHFVHAPGKQPYPDLNITLNRSSGPFCWRSDVWKMQLKIRLFFCCFFFFLFQYKCFFFALKIHKTLRQS